VKGLLLCGAARFAAPRAVGDFEVDVEAELLRGFDVRRERLFLSLLNGFDMLSENEGDLLGMARSCEVRGGP
jgi:hypothetical protein